MKTFLASALIFCFAGTAARADLVMSLTPAVQSGAHGMELVFSGTLLNSSSTDKVFLNDISFTLGGASVGNLVPEPNSFFANVPGILLPGETYASGEVFRVLLGAGAPVGDYGGTVSIIGGADISATANLAVSTFTVRETPMDNWRLEKFGGNVNDPAAADTADWDHDGILNLLEYALDLDPKISNVGALPAAGTSAGYLTLSFVPNPAASDLSFSIEASTNLVDWNTTDVEEVTGSNSDPPGLRTYRYRQLMDPGGRAFLRLRVVR